jgi:hypothetical protein
MKLKFDTILLKLKINYVCTSQNLVSMIEPNLLEDHKKSNVHRA